MPTCEQIWEMLSAYADEASLVERHTDSCIECARDLEFMRLTAVSISELPEVSPPSYLRNAILAATVDRTHWLDRIGFGRVTIASSRSRLAWSGAAVAAIAAVAIALRPLEPKFTENHRTSIASAPAVPANTIAPKRAPIEPKREAARNASIIPNYPGLRTDRTRDGIQVASLGIPITPPALNVTVKANVHLPLPRPTKREVVQAAKADKEPDKPMESTEKPTAKPAEPMEIAMATMADMMKTDKIGALSNMETTEAAVTAASPASYRIMLTGSGSVNAGTVATLADIRNRLRSSSVSSNCTLPLVRSNDRKDMTLDIYKGRF
jgi:hypothetical protein